VADAILPKDGSFGKDSLLKAENLEAGKTPRREWRGFSFYVTMGSHW
jgi:hypothetical protein